MVSSKTKNATIHDIYGFPLIADYRRTKRSQIRIVEDLTPEQAEWLSKEKIIAKWEKYLSNQVEN